MLSAWFADAQHSQARKIQVTMGPPRTFRYALFSQTTLEIKNNAVVVGDMYSQGKMTINNDATICGNIDNATFGVDVGTTRRSFRRSTGTTVRARQREERAAASRC